MKDPNETILETDPDDPMYGDYQYTDEQKQAIEDAIRRVQEQKSEESGTCT